ncbi:Thioredoxin superfamily protein [Euphorbia peplus]|nr:Thioredoxin superfamily protein [Euphorbia peplus]
MEKKMSSKALEWLNLSVSEPYYLFHILLFFSYFVLRTSSFPYFTPHLLHREIQAILTLAVFAAIKIVKDETWEAFLADMLFYAKLLLLAISLIMDYHLALCYILLYSAIYIVTEQPAFEGLGASSKLTPLQLETLLTEGNTSRFWLVEFRASCSSACIKASRCFPELSIVYSNKNLSFGVVDLGLFPNAAEKFGISLSGGMSQLPTYILFENAAEVTRFPELNFEAKSSHPPVTKRLLSKHFELDRLLVEYLHGK